MLDLDTPIQKDGRTLRDLYNNDFLHCNRCDQECTGTWEGICVECMIKEEKK